VRPDIPPRYRSHERQIAESLGIEQIEETGVLGGLKATAAWIEEALCISSPEYVAYAEGE